MTSLYNTLTLKEKFNTMALLFWLLKGIIVMNIYDINAMHNFAGQVSVLKTNLVISANKF